MLLSQALGLNSSQPLLDFVDIDLDLDFALYIDPAGFVDPRDEFAQACQDELRDFFEAVLAAIVRGDVAKGAELLEGLREPNETHLGISQGPPAGRGIGKIQAQQVLDSLVASPAAKTGMLSDLTDTALFIEGIGADKVSDMTTNIIRRHLIAYTQQQFEFLGIKIPDLVPAGLIWDTGGGGWIKDHFDHIPVIDDHKILLVPKRYVRWKGIMQNAAAHYYDKFVVNYIRDEQLRTDGNLVDVIRTKKGIRKVLTKKKVKRNFPLTKDFLARFSADHPAEFAKFKTAVKRVAPIGVRTIIESNGARFNEAAFDQGLVAALAAIPTGRRHATTYHHLITGILTYLFYPHLISPALELEIDEGRKRIDISFLNSAEFGFFKDRKDDAFTLSREVIVECKNYEDDIANPEIDQLNGRFDPRRGRFGFIICRTIQDQQRVVNRCRDVFRAQRGLILVLADADIAALLAAPSLDRDNRLQDMLRAKLRQVSA